MNNRKFVMRKDPVVDRTRQANQELRMRLNELSQLARMDNNLKAGTGQSHHRKAISQSVKEGAVAFPGSALQPTSKQSITTATSPPPSSGKYHFASKERYVQPQGSVSVAKLEN